MYVYINDNFLDLYISSYIFIYLYIPQFLHLVISAFTKLA